MTFQIARNLAVIAAFRITETLDGAFANPFPAIIKRRRVSRGHRVSLVVAVALLIAWSVVGALSQFPAWWFLQTSISGGLVTLLILLLVQHSQNRDMRALQAKVDELIRSSEAGNHWIAAEQRSESELSGLINERAKRVQAGA